MNLNIERWYERKMGEIDGMTRYLFKRIGDGHGMIGADRLEKKPFTSLLLYVWGTLSVA